MATGKTTIGRRCASELGFRFRDSDTFIERRVGKPIPAIFAEDGEEAFREAEVAAIRALAGDSRLVIATGGGAPMNPVNVENLRRTGIIILLQTTPDEILARVGNRSSRPLLADAEDPRARIEALLEKRAPVYQAAADASVDTTGRTREQVVEQVLAAYRQRCAVLGARCSNRPPRPPNTGRRIPPEESAR